MGAFGYADGIGGNRFGLGSDLLFHRLRLHASAVVQIVGIGHTDGIVVVRKQIFEFPNGKIAR